MGFDLGNLLQQYLGGANGVNPSDAQDHFDQTAQNAPRDAVANAVTQAMRSDQTPPFPQMLAQMFGNSSPDQRAGMLNQLIATAGPSLIGALGSGALGGVLGNLLGGNGNATAHITPEQASQISPEQVKELAEKAEQQSPSIVDRMGDFYSQHPEAVKAIGGAALAIVLGHLAQNIQRR